MKNMAIIDTYTSTYDGKIYGHYAKTAFQFMNILKEKYEVKIVGGKSYKCHFDKSDLRILPFSIPKLYKYNRFINLLNSLKCIINTLVVINGKYDILIFQESNKRVLYFVLNFYKNTKKRIFLIRYSFDYNPKTIASYNKVKHTISGIITSIELVGKQFDKPFICIPDYFPLEIDDNNEMIDLEYDFVIVGTISEYKDYESVIKAVNQSNYTLRIVGCFFDIDRYEAMKVMAKQNVKIDNLYLNDREYIKAIRSGRYVVLPYKMEYDQKSSGVILDVLYNNRPVIVPNLTSFQFVEEDSIGIVYQVSFVEILQKLKKIDEIQLKANIKIFCEKQKRKIEELVEFIENID